MTGEVRCYVGVGSNIDPETHIPAALTALDATSGVRLTGVSTFYRTSPVDAPGTPDFYNGVVELMVSLDLDELRALLDDVEAAGGRRRSADRHAPRRIDLDLLLFGDPAASEPGLAVLHPDVIRRSYVALPLLELAPGLVLPGDHGPLAAIASRFEDPGHEPLTEFSMRLAGLIDPT